MTDYIDPADLPDGEHLALVRWPDGTEAPRYVNRSGPSRNTASHTAKWEHTSARIVALLHRADECPGAGGWEPAELGPHLAGQTVRVETTSGAIEGTARRGGTGIIGVHLGEVGYHWIGQETVVRVFTRPDPHADLIEQLRDLLGSLPEGEIERVVMRAKAAKPGGAS